MSLSFKKTCNVAIVSAALGLSQHFFGEQTYQGPCFVKEAGALNMKLQMQRQIHQPLRVRSEPPSASPATTRARAVVEVDHEVETKAGLNRCQSAPAPRQQKTGPVLVLEEIGPALDSPVVQVGSAREEKVSDFTAEGKKVPVPASARAVANSLRREISAPARPMPLLGLRKKIMGLKPHIREFITGLKPRIKDLEPHIKETLNTHIKSISSSPRAYSQTRNAMLGLDQALIKYKFSEVPEYQQLKTEMKFITSRYSLEEEISYSLTALNAEKSSFLVFLQENSNGQVIRSSKFVLQAEDFNFIYRKQEGWLASNKAKLRHFLDTLELCATSADEDRISLALRNSKDGFMRNFSGSPVRHLSNEIERIIANIDSLQKTTTRSTHAQTNGSTTSNAKIEKSTTDSTSLMEKGTTPLTHIQEVFLKHEEESKARIENTLAEESVEVEASGIKMPSRPAGFGMHSWTPVEQPDMKDKFYKELENLGWYRTKGLGAGASAGVVEIVHLESRQKLAMKEIKIKKSDWLKSYEEAKIELEVLNKMGKCVPESVPKAYCHSPIYLNDEYFILPLERIAGKDLHEVTKGVRKGLKMPSAREMLSMFGQMLRFLVAMKKGEFAHRDLKTGNLMMTVNADGTYNMKAIDFGNSGALDEYGEGTSFYMAPELSFLRWESSEDQKAMSTSEVVTSYVSSFLEEMIAKTVNKTTTTKVDDRMISEIVDKMIDEVVEANVTQVKGRASTEIATEIFEKNANDCDRKVKCNKPQTPQSFSDGTRKEVHFTPNKSDTWALGLSFLHFLSRKSTTDFIKDEVFGEMLLGMYHQPRSGNNGLFLESDENWNKWLAQELDVVPETEDGDRPVMSELKELIKDCLIAKPDNRPEVEKLLERVDAVLERQ